jgi:hypothetical protein
MQLMCLDISIINAKNVEVMAMEQFINYIFAITNNKGIVGHESSVFLPNKMLCHDKVLPLHSSLNISIKNKK